MNNALSKTEPLLVRIVDALTKFQPNFKIQVPEGYQDENGFHYGVKPANKQITWPPAE